MEFDAYAKQYDDNFMGKGSKRFYRDLLKELEIAEGDSVLDVGCGTGYILSCIGEQRQIQGFGLDVSEPMIAVAKENIPAQKLYRKTRFDFCGEADMYGHSYFLCERTIEICSKKEV